MALNKRPTARHLVSVQTQITSISRANCVDLMIEAADILRCAPNMLHVAVNNLDCYLSGNHVDMRNLLVAGMTCLKMADCKGEDPYAYLCEGAITGYEFLVMEVRILKYLKNDVTVTTAYSFLKRYVCTAQRGRHAPLQGLDCVAAFLVDVSLLSTSMLRFWPSMVAASSVFLAQYILDPVSEKPWSAILRDYTMFQASDLQECVLVLHGFLGCDVTTRLPAITARNSRTGTGFAAPKIIPLAIPLHTFEDV